MLKRINVWSKPAIRIVIVMALILGLCTSCSPGSDTEVADNALHCKLTVNCETALKSGKLSNGKKKILPTDGVIYASDDVAFEEGDTVFDVLQKEMKNNKIHMESSESPIYKSQYIEGISNLYEFDCGDMSGWMYKVNGEFPRIGCSSYKVEKGNDIQWVYSCEMGKDIGGSNFEE